MAKKLLSLSLVVIMLFAFAVPAFASVNETQLKADIVAYISKGSYSYVTEAGINAGSVSATETSDNNYSVVVECDGYTFTCNAEYSVKGETYTITNGVEKEDESSNWFMSILIKIFSFFTNLFSNFSSILPF